MSIADKIARAKADLDEVFEAGKQAEYDAFWDAFQENGKRNRYNYGFSRFPADAFYPKYDIVPRENNWMFEAFNPSVVFNDPKPPLDLAARLEECGVKLIMDGGNAGNGVMYYAGVFLNANISTTPPFDVVAGSAGDMFKGCKSLHTIGKLNVTKDSISFDYAFDNCTALENIEFSGSVGQSLDFRWSALLTKASIESIINVLSTSATGKTATFSQTAVNNAFATSTGAGDGSTSAEWTALKNTRTNWTIALA
jgi:hypothetical protein